MSSPNALHHIALSTGNMKQQLEFFSDVLGMELQALFWMHGVEGAWHAFLKMGDASVSFVFIPGNDAIEMEVGKTHSGNGAGTSAPGTMQHISFNVATLDDLLTMRDRIRSRGVPVFGPIRHGLCTSVYFGGPENMALELATSDQAEYPLDSNGTWIDQDVVNEAGITAEELDRLMNPAPFERPSTPVAQPAYDASKPHMLYPKEAYEAMLATPDEVVTGGASVIDPPNAPNAANA